MTAFGLLGDKNNLYKGLRVYINKCNGRDCYDDDVIEKQFHNSKFYLYYLGDVTSFCLNLNRVWGPWLLVWALTLSPTDISTRRLTPGLYLRAFGVCQDLAGDEAPASYQ